MDKTEHKITSKYLEDLVIGIGVVKEYSKIGRIYWNILVAWKWWLFRYRWHKLYKGIRR